MRDFVTSRFYELEKETLDNLDIETSRILIASPSLKIQDEDSLYHFVRSRSEKDLRFASLFFYFEYLSVDRIENFSSFVCKNFLENISARLWTRICRRLILETNPKEPSPHNYRNDMRKKLATAEPRREFVYDSSKPREGVIAHLTRECGGNVHDRRIVNVTASNVYNEMSNFHPKNVDFATDSYLFQ